MKLRKRLIAMALLLTLSVAAEPAQKPEPKNQKEKVDQYGDPLPPGALARLGTVRFRHGGNVFLLAYSGDGKKLVGYTESGIIVWDTGTGKELRRLSDQEIQSPHPIAPMDVSPDGSLLAVKYHLWDLTTGKKRPSPPWPARPTAIHFAPDGKSLAVAAGNDKIYLVDLATGKQRSFDGPESRGNVFCMAFSANGKYLAAGFGNSSLGLWEVATGKKVQRLTNPLKSANAITAVAFSADGKTVAWAAHRVIFLTETATGKEMDRLVNNLAVSINGLAFSPNGGTLVASTRDNGVFVWDVSTAEVRFTLDSGTNTGKSRGAMALSPDGKTVAIGTSGAAVRLWNVDTGKEKFTEFPGHFSAVTRLIFSPDGKALFSGGESPVRKSSDYSDGLSQPIRLWDTAKWQQTRVFPVSASTFALSPDGKHLAALVKDTVHLIDVATGKDSLKMKPIEKKKKGELTFRVQIYEVAFSLDGRKVVTVESSGPNQRSYSLRYWDSATGQQLHQERLWFDRDQLSQPHFSRDGHTLFMHGVRNGLIVFDVESRRDRSPPRGQKEWNFAFIGISPDGRMLAEAPIRSKDCFVVLEEVWTGKEIALLRGHELNLSAVAWSADGRMAATGDTRNDFQSEKNKALPSIRLWDTLTGKELVKFDGFGADVASLALSPDGAFLAAGLNDSTILIYDVRKFQPQLATQMLGKPELESCWADLAGDIAAKAYQAAWKLIGAPAQTVPWLRERLKPTVAVEANQLKQWIADLGSDQAPVRSAAVKGLQQVLPQAETALRQALKVTKSGLAKGHLERLLSKLETSATDNLRTLRAVMVLERIGNPEARGILEALAKGGPGARETEEAQAALARLAGHLH